MSLPITHLGRSLLSCILSVALVLLIAPVGHSAYATPDGSGESRSSSFDGSVSEGESGSPSTDDPASPSPTSTTEALSTSDSPSESALEIAVSDVNPDYLAYLDDPAVHGVASTLDLGYLNESLASLPRALDAGDELPTTFDLREDNRIGAVLDQGSTENCWAFAALASAEASILDYFPHTLFSQSHLAWFSYTGDEEEELNGSAFAGAAAYGRGAFEQQAVATLAAWEGPVSHSKAPFKAETMDEALRYEADYHLQDAFYLPSSMGDYYDRPLTASTAAVKRIIKDEGPVTVSIATKGDGTYTTDRGSGGKAHTTFYSDTKKTIDHTVLIVGWDDTFSKSNFSDLSQPHSDGAWLVRNSWGTSWGDDGYFWLSYEDAAAVYGVCYQLESAANYSNHYQFDTMGWRTSLSLATAGGQGDAASSSKSAFMANIFTAEGAEDLKAVSFYTTDEATSYEISVFRNPDAGNPTSGERIGSSQRGQEAYPGYHTVELESALQTNLNAGDTFSVVVELTNPVYGKVIPAEAAIGKGTGWQPEYLGKDSNGNAEVSYVSVDGATWEPLGKHISDSQGVDVYVSNVCLKAFTQDAGTGGDAWPPAENGEATLGGLNVRVEYDEEIGDGSTVPRREDFVIDPVFSDTTGSWNADVFMPGASNRVGAFRISFFPSGGRSITLSSATETKTASCNTWSDPLSFDPDVEGSMATLFLVAAPASGDTSVKTQARYEVRLIAGKPTFDTSAETVSFDEALYEVHDPDGGLLASGDSVSAWSVIDGRAPCQLNVIRKSDGSTYPLSVPTYHAPVTSAQVGVDYSKQTLILREALLLESSVDPSFDEVTIVYTGSAVTPGSSIYVRKGSDATHFHAREALRVDFPAQRPAPEALVPVKVTPTTMSFEAKSGDAQREFSVDGLNWTYSNELTGLTPGTYYTVYQRLIAESKGEAVVGFPSAPVTVGVTTPSVASRYDLREVSALPDVRDQGTYSTCWAFAALASLESNRMIQGASGAVDLSEAALTTLTFQRRPLYDSDASAKDSYITSDSHGYCYGLRTGGTWSMAASTLARWQGAANETDVPYRQIEEFDYDFFAAGEAMNADAAAVANDDSIRLTKALQLPSPLSSGGVDVSRSGSEGGALSIDTAACAEIKQAVASYGALDIGMAEPFEDDGYWGGGSRGDCHWFFDAATTGMKSDHALALVGWDDAFDRMNFAVAYTGQQSYDTSLAEVVEVDGSKVIVPKDDGAWLLRNSRGVSFGDGGYIWVPYAEASLRAPVAFVAEEVADGEARARKNYQYDGLHASLLTATTTDGGAGSATDDGGVASRADGRSGSEALRAANVFTAMGHERLSSVGTWTTLPGMRVSIEVYVGLADPADPTSGALAAKSDYTISYAGYHTLDLANTVELQEGQAFSIVVSERELIPFGEQAKQGVPLEAAWVKSVDADGVTTYDSAPVVDPSQSYFYENGAWTDISTVADSLSVRVGAPVGNVALKAFTSPFDAGGEDSSSGERADEATSATRTALTGDEAASMVFALLAVVSAITVLSARCRLRNRDR